MKRLENGFTFIEMVVAIMVIGLVVGGLTATLATVLSNPNQNREMATAQFLLQGMAEQILMERRNASYGYSGFTSTFASITVSNLNFTRTVSISQPAANTSGCPAIASAGHCKLVILTVSAPSSAAMKTTLLLTSY
ncbi:MAG: type II secretion system protein [Magnetococcales bacterium]|nr:type II secretion system protein [Magnetococcales bacterium]NGZ27372.1 type II secretion system protein [Magnetococcales bacterium]